MSDTFRILHLSDSHIGNPRSALDSLEVFESLFRDIKTFASTKGPPSVIIFSGDLAWGQMEESTLKRQYVESKRFIERVLEAAKSDVDRTPILFVPGNHDLDRTAIGTDQTAWRNSLVTQREADEVVYNEMQANSVLWKRTLERQLQWSAFVQSILHPSSTPLSALILAST